MELRQLKYFIKAAELLNFTQAAKSACIAESSLSIQIKRLEGELGTALFKREKKRVELTEAGEKLLPYARLVMTNIQDASIAVKDVEEMRSGLLRIGGIFSLSSLITDTLANFSIEYPGIQVKMLCKSGRRLFEMLRSNELDMVFTFEAPNIDEQLDSIELFRSPLMVIVHKEHPLAKREELSLNDLQGWSLALPERGMHARDVLEGRFPDKMRQLQVQLELNDINILYKLIHTKHWISVMPLSTKKDEKDLVAIRLTEAHTDIKAALYWRKDSYRKIAAETFIGMLLKDLSDNPVLYCYRNNLL